MAVIKAFLKVRQKRSEESYMFNSQKIYKNIIGGKLRALTSLVIPCSKPKECHVVIFSLLD